MKKKLLFILMTVISFTFGFFTNDYLNKTNRNHITDIYGTYTSEFSTISINHDCTYHYAYPFSYGKISKIEDNIYFLSDGVFNGYIALFIDNEIKLITSDNNGVIKTFSKFSNVEMDLSNR